MNFTKMFVFLSFKFQSSLYVKKFIPNPCVRSIIPSFHILNYYFANNFIIENQKNMKKIEAKCQITNKIHAINVYGCFNR